MKTRTLLYIFSLLLLSSCTQEKKEYAYTLQPTDDILTYELDADVRTPLEVHTFQTDKPYLYFQNLISPELLIYDLRGGALVKKLVFPKEGINAIPGGFYNEYMIEDFHHIYISNMGQAMLYETDTTRTIQRKISFQKTTDGYEPWVTLGEGVWQWLDGKLYLPLEINYQLGGKAMEQSRLLAAVDTVSGKVVSLPMTFPRVVDFIERGVLSMAGYHSACFNGESFVYSFDYMHQLMVVNPQTHAVEYKEAQSQYISKLRLISRNVTDQRTVWKQTCELPSYGKILYDPQKEVYYRIVFVPQEIEPDKDLLTLIRGGRKQFAVMILDKQLRVIGEHLFPAYTYNPNVCFVSDGSLYISLSHPYHPDYSDDFLRLQRMDLMRK